MPTALITGASRGLGLALSREMDRLGWHLIVDARDEGALRAAVTDLGSRQITAIAGDISDPDHRDALAGAVQRAGGLDLLVNNASTLGISPLPHLSDYPIAELQRVLQVNVLAPLALIQALLPNLIASRGAIVNVTSDAAAEPYEGWGGYGASKAALEQIGAVLAAEQPEVRVYTFDPGDMRTKMHQDAFPGEDISDRPEPEAVVPSLVRLITEERPSGRYRAGDLARLQESSAS
ncbi:MAG TPA: SDR family NAD(P)-dependent oxidoreductase [Actinomycetota bacterium]|nr:SDR family NAD(P)-dependent oxidoreductase [Actinomycetota bacterium]